MLVGIDAGHGGKCHRLDQPQNTKSWAQRTCLQCGVTFYVRKCYANRGQGKFCSTSCGTTYRNIRDNPAKMPEVKEKISANHADVSGTNNPMYGRRGRASPGWKDGRNKISGDIWRKVALLNKPPICEICGSYVEGRNLHVHHKDKDRTNNSLDNLQVVCVECHNNVLHIRSRDNLGRFTKEVM